MRVLQKAPDGGSNSGVTGYFLIECKSLFSIVLLHFAEGSREAYHEHAFNAVTVWLKGKVQEQHLDGSFKRFKAGQLKYTPRGTFHRIVGLRSTWALSVRGPWRDHWRESRMGRIVTLTHGRKEV
jgi:quercetin dioxygenase-like cupin family protein